MSEETVPHPSERALRTMSVVRWILLAAVAAIAASTWWTVVFDAPAESTEEARYYCPMHPQITSPDPGSCPICFMTLEPIASRVPDDGHEMSEEMDEPEESPLEGTTPVMLTLERRQASGITVETASRRELSRTVRWPATVRALRGATAEVRVRTAAYVERVLVSEPGTRVRRGQVLAWVYSPEILRAEEELLAARAWEGPGTSGATPSIDEAAGRRLELLGVPASEVDAVRSGGARRRVPLRSPITGTLTQFAAAPGTYASEGSVLFEITDFSRLQVVATVLAAEERSLASNGPAVFSPAGEATLPAGLTFAFVEPVLDPLSRGAQVVFTLDNASGSLRPGEIGDVLLSPPPRSVLVVPRDAVIDRGRGSYLFVETEPGLFSPREVSVGSLFEEQREILEGLQEGERVVSRGGFLLDSESRLSAALAPSPTPDHPAHEGHE